ncbi:MAG: CCA tRNA nucleotidyltransferase [Archangium sp.]
MEVVRGLHAAGFRAFLVGGCVRDLLRGKKPKDFDLATSAKPEDVQKHFKKVIPTGIEHGTVTVVVNKEHVEVTTFRAEAEYVDGRRPSKVEFHEDIEADLGRRDFTMNAIAWDPVSGAIVDPFKGQEDLNARTIRAVRVPLERFLEDGLRPMRAVRFATVLEFTIEPETERAITQTLHVFKKVAGERIHQEFVKLLLAPSASTGLELLRRTGLLGEFFPEARNLDAVGKAKNDEVVRLAVLLLGVPRAREVLLRLKFPSRTAEEVGALAQHWQLPATTSSDADVRRWLAKLDASRAGPLFDVHEALGTAPDGLRNRVEAILATNPPLTAKALALDGKGIMAALGTGPSPVVGQATRHLLEIVLEDPSKNTREALAGALRGFPQAFPQPSAPKTPSLLSEADFARKKL